MDLKKQHDEDRAEVAARFPGPDYREILALLHRLLQPARYLEIGVNTGKSFALAKSPTRAVGVDPEPRVTRIDNPNANLVKATSDAFFGELDRVRTNVTSIWCLSTAFTPLSKPCATFRMPRDTAIPVH